MTKCEGCEKDLTENDRCVLYRGSLYCVSCYDKLPKHKVVCPHGHKLLMDCPQCSKLYER